MNSNWPGSEKDKSASTGWEDFNQRKAAMMYGLYARIIADVAVERMGYGGNKRFRQSVGRADRPGGGSEPGPSDGFC